jgi:molecular chaperone DnaK
MVGYHLGLDVGTSFTAAAVERDGRVEMLQLGTSTSAIPSVVFVCGDGELLVGDAAERRAPDDPGRVAREFKRRFGDPTPLILGGSPYGAERLVARLLLWAYDRACERHGEPPETVAVTHPANWGPYKLELLAQVLRHAGLGAPLLVPEPVAAAAWYASQASLLPGAVMAVYDLGGGTFEATVLQKRNGRFAIVGEAAGDKLIGGDLFDDRLYHHLGQSHLPADIWNRLRADESAEWRRANRVFRRQVRCAKEALSYRERASIQIPAPVGRELRVTRGEFEQLIRTDLDATLDILASVLDGSGVEWAALAGLYAVGGSSRIPLVTRLLQERFGRADQSTEPETAIALGGAYRAVAACSSAGGASGCLAVSPSSRPDRSSGCSGPPDLL